MSTAALKLTTVACYSGVLGFFCNSSCTCPYFLFAVRVIRSFSAYTNEAHLCDGIGVVLAAGAGVHRFHPSVPNLTRGGHAIYFTGYADGFGSPNLQNVDDRLSSSLDDLMSARKKQQLTRDPNEEKRGYRVLYCA